MYISNIKIENFRNFKSEEIEFNDGVNVIIGHNNAGKTNLIKALSLVLDNQNSKKLEFDDINKNISVQELKNSSPKIRIAITIKKGKDEDPDDLVTVANWLTKLDESFEAMLTYEFFLPSKKEEEYRKSMSEIQADEDIQKAWAILKHEYIRFYNYKIWGGDIINQSIADSESLQKFDFQFLNAIRDVERDMLTGKNTLLKEVFDFFMDFEIKKDKTKSLEVKYSEIKEKKQDFSNKANLLIQELQNRIRTGKEEILSYAKNTGASFNQNIPDFEGSISEVEMYSVLKLIVEDNTGIKIPATHNGLGYNNLIFMSLLLAKMQVNSDIDYLESNAKIFTILAIEEPEAHLHPSMQYKFLKFLNQNKTERKVRQIFVTTHSTHIASAVSLDEIICLHCEKNKIHIGYPKKVFLNSDGTENQTSKKYVQRFLDATKSDMLFAQKILFVEGVSEQLLISICAEYLDKSLEDNHVGVINVGGRYFSHFLHLFDGEKAYTIPKEIICLTDRDPENKKKGSDDRFKKCYPFEYNQDDSFSYKFNSFADSYVEGEHQNITVYSPAILKGKTFEYEIVFNNPSLDLLITDTIDNKKEIQDLMDLYKIQETTLEELLSKLKNSNENKRIIDSIKANSSFSDDEKKRAIIASRYLNSIQKGDNALELSLILKENLENKGKPEFKNFNVPEYITKAINKLCQQS